MENNTIDNFDTDESFILFTDISPSIRYIIYIVLLLETIFSIVFYIFLVKNDDSVYMTQKYKPTSTLFKIVMGYFLVQTILFIVLFSLFFIYKDSLNEKEINFIFISLIIYIGINFLNIVVHLCMFNSIFKERTKLPYYWFMKIENKEYLVIYIVKMISMVFILYLFSYILFNKKVNINSNVLKVLLPILLTLVCLFLQRVLYFLASYNILKFDFMNNLRQSSYQTTRRSNTKKPSYKSFPSYFLSSLFTQITTYKKIPQENNIQQKNNQEYNNF